MRISTYLYTDKGGRETNEDACDYFVEDGNFGVWVLCDGLGGHSAGETASDITVKTVINQFCVSPSFAKENMGNIIQAANEKLLDMQDNDSSLLGMCTTFAGLFTDFQSAICCHVGDTRIYYLKKNKIIYQTQDHSVTQLAVLTGEIDKSQMRFHEDRNKLLRALGMSEHLKIEISQDFDMIEAGDSFLICSDGFWEYVFEDEIETDSSNSITPRQWFELMYERIMKRIPENCDNMSAICIFITE